MGFVYMIKCNITNECYIGSSVQKYKNIRFNCHKGKYNTCISKQIINRNNYEFIIIEDILDIDKKELRIKEQEYMDKYDCINKQRAYISEEQKKEYDRQYNKEYNKTNKEYRKEYKKKHNKKYKEQQKEYYINNKEYRKDYFKEYNFFKKYNDVIAEYINEINQY
jgi:hypothetical protein